MLNTLCPMGFWMIPHSQVHVLRWSIFVMAKGLFPRAWVKKSFYFQVRLLPRICCVKRIAVLKKMRWCCGIVWARRGATSHWQLAVNGYLLLLLGVDIKIPDECKMPDECGPALETIGLLPWHCFVFDCKDARASTQSFPCLQQCQGSSNSFGLGNKGWTFWFEEQLPATSLNTVRSLCKRAAFALKKGRMLLHYNMHNRQFNAVYWKLKHVELKVWNMLASSAHFIWL